jgi:hypothetical protein
MAEWALYAGNVSKCVWTNGIFGLVMCLYLYVQMDVWPDCTCNVPMCISKWLTGLVGLVMCLYLYVQISGLGW